MNSQQSHAETTTGTGPRALAPLVVRGVFGGVLMGLANLVPGISGGTMLLAAGVYRAFIDAIVEVTSLRFRLGSVALLGSIVGSAGLAIALLAGPVVHLVVEHRWVMYSLFVGLTLGGVPLLAGMIRASAGGSVGGRAALIGGVLFGFAGMVGLALAQRLEIGALGGVGGGGSGIAMMFVAGIAGASAMVLPGVSGGYLLLVLRQYEPVLSSIRRAKDAAVSMDVGGVLGEWDVLVPLGLGVVAGIVGVSHALRWLLARHERATLGVLLGLLLGAVVGLWPFQRGVEPVAGDSHRGYVLTAEEAAEIPAEKWRLEFFSPSGAQAGGAIGLVIAGFVVTLGVARLGAGKPARREAAGAD